VKSDNIAYLDITYFENEYASATRSLDQIVISRPSSQSNKFDFISNQDISEITLEVISGYSEFPTDIISIASISESRITIDVDVSHISKNFIVKLKNISVSPEAVTSNFNLVIKNNHYSPEFQSSDSIRIGDPQMFTNSDQVLIISDPKVQLRDIHIVENSTVAAINTNDGLIIQLPDTLQKTVKWHTAPTLKLSQAKVGAISINSLDSTKLNIVINNDFSPGDSFVLTEGYVKVNAMAPDTSFNLIGFLNGRNPSADLVNIDSLYVTKPQIEIKESKSFVVNDTSVLFPQITITESGRASSIYSLSPELEDSILIKFDDDCFSWDTNVTSPTFSGTYAGAPSPVNYTSNNRVAGIKINEIFSKNHTLIINGLKVNLCSDRVISSKIEFSIRGGGRFYLASSSISDFVSVGKPKIISTSDDYVNINTQSKIINKIIIKEDSEVPLITPDRQLVIWAPDPLKWDSNIDELHFSGSALTKANSKVHYVSNNKGLQIEINNEFSMTDSLIIHNMRVMSDSSYAGSLPNTSTFTMSLPEKGDDFYPVHINNSGAFNIYYRTATIGFANDTENLIFIKGDTSNVQSLDVTIYAGEMENSINEATDIKIQLPDYLNIYWAENQNEATINDSLSSDNIKAKISIDSLQVMDGSYRKIINIPVKTSFSISDSVTIENLQIENKTNIYDESKRDYISLLSGEYGSNDYTESGDNGTILVVAPQMKFSTGKDISIINGNLTNIRIPDIEITDDPVFQILNKDTIYYLSVDDLNDSNYYNWNSDNDGIVSVKWGDSNENAIVDLIFASISLDADTEYNLVLKDGSGNLISKSLNILSVGAPIIKLQTDKIWVDLDSIKNVKTFSINESINPLKWDRIKLYFDNNYLKWDTSIVQDFDFDYNFNDDSLIITNYSPGSESELDLSLFNIFMAKSVINNIKLEESLVVLNCEFIDEYNKFKITDSLTLHFDPVISDEIPFSGSKWDSLSLVLMLNSEFFDANSIINNPIILFVTDSDSFIYDLEIDLSNLELVLIHSGGISQVEFLFPDTLLDNLSSLQEYNNVDLYFSLSNLEADDLRRSNSESSGFKLTPISFGWGEGIKNISIEDTDRYLNPDSNNIVFTLDGTVAGTSRIQLKNLITDTMYGLNSVDINNTTIEILGTAIRNSLGDDADGIYDIIVQKIIDSGYSFPFIKRLIIDTQPPLYSSVVPTTDIFNEVWDSNSIHSVTDEDEIIFTYLNYPYQIADDSIIFITDKMRTPFNLSGFQFNDSLTVDVVITVIDSLGSTSEIPPLNPQAVDGMYEFQKLLQIELGDSMIYPFIQGQDSLIIQYTSTDMAGNVSVHKVKYNLYTEADFSGLVNRIFNYPNPFSSLEDGTKIRYVLTDDGLEGKYIVFDAKGELVYHYELSSDELMKGTHTINWSGKYLNDKYVLATGIYFGFLDIDDTIAKHKLVIMN